MNGGATKEIKVGLFVFISFILLSVVIFSISDFYTTQPKYNLRIRFNFANGIQVGAPVRVAGVGVGEVRSVRVYREEATQRTLAELGIRLSNEAKVEEDAVAYINTLGLIGEKYLEIVPGSSGSNILKSGDILVGKDSIPTEQIMETGFRVVRQLEQTINAIHTFVSDEGTREALKGTLVNSKEAAEKFNQLLEQTNAVMSQIRQGQGTVGKLLTQDDLYRDIKEVMTDIKAHPWKLFYRPKEAKR